MGGPLKTKEGVGKKKKKGRYWAATTLLESDLTDKAKGQRREPRTWTPQEEKEKKEG